MGSRWLFVIDCWRQLSNLTHLASKVTEKSPLSLKGPIDVTSETKSSLEICNWVVKVASRATFGVFRPTSFAFYRMKRSQQTKSLKRFKNKKTICNQLFVLKQIAFCHSNIRSWVVRRDSSPVFQELAAAKTTTGQICFSLTTLCKNRFIF